MALFRIQIDAQTDWFEAIILDNAAGWVNGPLFTVNSALNDIAYTGGVSWALQMQTQLIGFGKSKAWDTALTSISVYLDTPNTTLHFDSRKGAAGPVRYSSYGPTPGAPQIDYRVHDLNIDPQPLVLALTSTVKLELDRKADDAAREFDPKALHLRLTTIRPSDDPTHNR